MTNDVRIDTEVAIVGGGPVGLCVALDLASRGVDCVVLERRDQGAPVFPTANHISVRTMEHLRRHGLSSPVRNAFRDDWGGDVVCLTHIGGHEVVRVEDALAESSDRRDSPEREVWAPKPVFDPILEFAVQSSDAGRILYGVTVESVQQDDEGVVCSGTNQSGRRVIVRSAYAVACDGAGSRTRDALGIDLLGPPALPISVHSVFFRSRRVAEAVPSRAVQYVLLGTESGPTQSPVGAGLMITVDGHDLWRIHGIGLDAQDEAGSAAWLARHGAPDAEIISMSEWTPHQAVCSSFRSERIFLAGDAAHVVTPFGGLGVNTGMADAFNLGWKLEAALRGWGGPELLESYEFERRIAALELLGYQGVEFSGPEATRRGPPMPMFEVPGPILWRDTAEGAAARQDFGKMFVASRGNEYVKPQIDLGTRYDGSPIVVDDGAPAPDRSDERVYEPTAKPGGRAPHVWLGTGRSTLDLFGPGFTLIRTSQAVNPAPFEQAAQARGVPLHSRTELGAAAVYEQPLTLIRPDGVVAWRGAAAPASPLGIIDQITGGS